MLTQNLYYNYHYQNPKYLIIGCMDPKPSTPHTPIYLHMSPLKGPNDWVHGPLGYVSGGQALHTCTFQSFEVRAIPVTWGMLLLGFYRDNGKENGNYYITIGYMLGL